MSWGLVAGAVISAGSAAYQGNKQKKAAEKAAKAQKEAAATPWTQTTTNNPWGAAMPYLEGALGQNEQVYNQTLAALAAAGKKGGGGGPSQTSQQLVDLITRTAMGGDPLVNQGRNFASQVLPGSGASGGYNGGQIFNPADFAGVKGVPIKVDEAWVRANVPGMVKRNGQVDTAEMQKQLANPKSNLAKKVAAAQGGVDTQARNAAMQQAQTQARAAPPAAGGQPAGGGGGEDDTFDYNPVYADLNERLKNASFDRGGDLISKFLGANFGDGGTGFPASGAAAGAGGAGGAGSRGGGGGGLRVNSDWQRAQYGGGGGGGVPDTVGGQNSFFADEIRKLADPSNFDPANDPTLAPMLEALKREMNEDLQYNLDDIGDASEGHGMYGGSGRALESARTREEGMEAYGGTAAGVMGASRESAYARLMQALGLTNDRDLGLLNANTQKDIAATNASAASAGAGAASEAAMRSLDLQRELGLRGQNLDAITALMGHDRAGLGSLQGLGDSLSGDRFAALSTVPGFNDLNYSGFERALGANQSQDAARGAASARGRSNAMQNALAPGAAFQDYLRNLGGLVGTGPSSTTTTGTGDRGGGAAAAPYGGPSGWEAGLTNLAGGLGSLWAGGAFQKQPPKAPAYVAPIPNKPNWGNNVGVRP